MRQTRWVVAGLVAVATLLSAGPALAKNPYPPPSHGSATVVPSRIQAGQCAVFSGTGFMPGTTVAIADNGASAGTALADVNGDFSKQICEGANAKRGKHTLTGSGTGSDGNPLTVSAVLTVTGVKQSASSTTTSPQGSSSDPEGTATGPQANTSSPQGSLTGSTTGGLGAPPPVSGLGTESQVPAAGSNSGTHLLAYGLSGLGFAFLASLLILLLERRRRGGDGTSAAPA